MKLTHLVSLAFGSLITWSALRAEEVTKDPSPGGKFAMLLTRAEEGTAEEGTASLTLIEVSSRRVVLNLTAEISNPSADDSSLLWSGDSKRVAFFEANRRGGTTTVYFRNDSGFMEISLPELPSCEVPRKRGEGVVKDIESTVEPKRWLKSGVLVLHAYVEWETNLGFVRCSETIDFAFDAQDKPSVRTMTRKISRTDSP
jgi:hypothetical protein